MKRHLFGSGSSGLGEVREFIEEGWQSTDTMMPSMPVGNPWSNIETLLKAESAIRNNERFDLNDNMDVDIYWLDLIRLLQVFKYKNENNPEMTRKMRDSFACEVYRIYIDKMLGAMN